MNEPIDQNPEYLCWCRFLSELYDDYAVAPQSEGLFLDARTLRAWANILGENTMRQDMQRLLDQNTIKVMSDYLQASANSHVIEILFYP